MDKRNRLMLTKEIEYDDLQKQVAQIVAPTPCKMVFSMFVESSPLAENSWIVNAPDLLSQKPIWSGRIQFVINYWRFGDVPRFSPSYTRPTWKDLIIACNDLMIKYGDGDAIFFEGTKDPEETKKLSGTRYVELVIGS